MQIQDVCIVVVAIQRTGARRIRSVRSDRLFGKCFGPRSERCVSNLTLLGRCLLRCWSVPSLSAQLTLLQCNCPSAFKEDEPICGRGREGSLKRLQLKACKDPNGGFVEAD